MLQVSHRIGRCQCSEQSLLYSMSLYEVCGSSRAKLPPMHPVLLKAASATSATVLSVACIAAVASSTCPLQPAWQSCAKTFTTSKAAHKILIWLIDPTVEVHSACCQGRQCMLCSAGSCNWRLVGGCRDHLPGCLDLERVQA